MLLKLEILNNDSNVSDNSDGSSGSSKITKLIKNIEEYRLMVNTTNINLYDIPDEFCDPIMMTPINNPILLPESKIFMEKNIILSHLIDNETDPFNRTKLTKMNLEEFNKLPETLEKIAVFKEGFRDWVKKHQESKKS